MQKLVTVQEVENEGLMKLLGKQVLVFCVNYNYTGKLIGVNEKCILLQDGKIVYETGAFDLPQYKDAQKVNQKEGGEMYIMLSAIESFCEGK